MMKKVKSQNAYLIDVAPESEFEEYRDVEGVQHSSSVYNENGHLLTDIKFDNHGQTTGTSVYKYNDKGFLIFEETLDENGQTEEKVSWEVDENGRILKKFVHYLDDTIDTIHYQYNDEGLLIQVIQKDEDGQEEHREEYEYNNGKRIAERHYEYGALETENIFEYDDNGRLIEVTASGPEEAVTLVNEYDEKGNRIKTLKYTADDKLVEKHLMTYDAQGRLIGMSEETPYKKNNVVMELDAAGNAIRQTETDRNGQLVSLVEREYDADGNVLRVSATIAGQPGAPHRKYILKYVYEFY
jgi:antitoxin component YwqK of YwqJK toxin-antitoxin module